MEFLLKVNKFAGRSFNDLSQYPIFPWVISDYSSLAWEFKKGVEKEKVYRDLTKHTGNLNESKKQDAINKLVEEKRDGVEMILAIQYGNEPF